MEKSFSFLTGKLSHSTPLSEDTFLFWLSRPPIPSSTLSVSPLRPALVAVLPLGGQDLASLARTWPGTMPSFQETLVGEAPGHIKMPIIPARSRLDKAEVPLPQPHF